MRMEARRTLNTEWLDGDGHVIGEDGKSEMPEGYKEWRDKQIVDWLDRGSTNSPTNHSTTMTNPKHAEKALAYDVAIGVCYLTPEQLYDLRIEADWRMFYGFPKAIRTRNMESTLPRVQFTTCRCMSGTCGEQ